MGYYPRQMKPEQPGIDGIQYARNLGFIYYTATAKKLFMRVAVAPGTLGRRSIFNCWRVQALARFCCENHIARKATVQTTGVLEQVVQRGLHAAHLRKFQTLEGRRRPSCSAHYLSPRCKNGGRCRD
jgi:hypothetical protein